MYVLVPKKEFFLLFHYFVFNINSISFPVLYSFNINKDKDKHDFQNDEIAVLKLLVFEIFFLSTFVQWSSLYPKSKKGNWIVFLIHINTVMLKMKNKHIHKTNKYTNYKDNNEWTNILNLKRIFTKGSVYCYQSINYSIREKLFF